MLTIESISTRQRIVHLHASAIIRHGWLSHRPYKRFFFEECLDVTRSRHIIDLTSIKSPEPCGPSSWHVKYVSPAQLDCGHNMGHE